MCLHGPKGRTVSEACGVLRKDRRRQTRAKRNQAAVYPQSPLASHYEQVGRVGRNEHIAQKNTRSACALARSQCLDWKFLPSLRATFKTLVTPAGRKWNAAVSAIGILSRLGRLTRAAPDEYGGRRSDGDCKSDLVAHGDRPHAVKGVGKAIAQSLAASDFFGFG